MPGPCCCPAVCPTGLDAPGVEQCTGAGIYYGAALSATAMFVFIGAIPHTEWLDGVVARDEHGFILTGPDLDGPDLKGWSAGRHPHLLEGSVPGVFAAGDVRHGSVKRVASAVGEGSVAVMFIHRYLSDS